MYKMLGWNSRKPNEHFKLVTESLKFNQQTPYLTLAQKPLCEFSLSENTGCDSITSHLSGGCGLGVRGAGVAGKNASCPECRVGRRIGRWYFLNICFPLAGRFRHC